MNDLPVGQSVDVALCLAQVFQFTVSIFSSMRGVEVTCRGADEG